MQTHACLILKLSFQLAISPQNPPMSVQMPLVWTYDYQEKPLLSGPLVCPWLLGGGKGRSKKARESMAIRRSH